MTKIKRVLHRGLRLPVKFLRKLDRTIQRGFSRAFKMFYKIKFLRPITKKTYRFVHYHHRISAAALAVIMIAGAAIPVVQPYLRSQRYQLSSQAQGLLGEADKDLTKKLTFDDKQQLFQFNKDAKKVPTTEGNPLEKLQSQVGGGGEKDNQLYSVDVPKDLSRGVTYYDNQMELNFKLTPQFSTMLGEQKEGHLIYPLNGTKGQLAYTVGAGGLKENMVLYKSPGNEFNMEYKLDLPKSLEAKLIPETGEIGIYSADPALFGNISYGTSDDQAKVEAARNNSEKTFLTFKIPAPVVLGLNGADQKAVASIDSYFELSGDTLRVVTKGLDKAEYPLSIDPTVSVDSTADFQTGNTEDNNLSVESGDLKRGALTGGSLGSWNTGTNIATPTGTSAPVAYHDSVAYNGYLYILGGWNSSHSNVVRYVPINTNGSIGGTWSTTTVLPSTNAQLNAVAYNGYMYITGGENGSTPFNSVYYAPINSNGSLGSWAPTESFTTARFNHAAVAYNGHMYIAGGDNNSDFLDDVQYAPINADGSLGTWQATTSLEGEITETSFLPYNGYMYRIGGDWTETVSYAPINANGTLGSWTFTSSMPSVRYSHGAAVYNGYLYVTGGSGLSTHDTTLYAPINANGTIGSWQSTTTLPSARSHMGAVAYNGYFYVTGGDTGSSRLNQVRYAAVNAPGVTGGYSTTNNFGTGRERHAAVAYNGYLYVIGGRKGSSSTACRNSGSSTLCNETRYASISANGTVGSWNTATYFANARYGHAAVAYNGYLYILGGDTGSRTNNVQRATINLSNGSLSSWTNMTSFTTARYLHTAEVYNGYMYIIGGDTSGATTNVQFTPIEANGNLTGWNDTEGLPSARAYHASTVYGGYLYVLGGNTGSYLNTVYYAPLNSDGSISPGAWDTTATLNTARDSFTAVAYNGYLYVAGGTVSGGSQTTNTEYAPINSDGSLGSWQSDSSLPSLPAARSSHTAVTYNGFIYQVGGFGSGYNNTVYYAQINNGGAGIILSGGTESNNFTTARIGHASVAYNGYLYILGGEKSSTGTACRDSGTEVFCNDVQYASISSNGTLGTWATANNFSIPRSGATAVTYGGYMYIIGGFISYPSDRTDNVQKALICTGANTGIDGCSSTAGSLGSWSSVSSLPDQIFAHASVAYKGYLYTMGGNWQLDEVYYAQINYDGTLGDWESTNSFNIARNGLRAVAYNDYMYLIGGYSQSGGNVYHSEVEYAPINNDGTIGTWKYTTDLPTTLTGHAAVALNGYLYVLGGYVGSGLPSSRTYYAPINANGTIGNWQSTTSLSTGRQETPGVTYNGYIYMVGGMNGAGSYSNTTERVSVSSIPRKATYSKLMDLGLLSTVTNITYSGTLPGDLLSINYKVAENDGVFSGLKSAIPPLGCEDSQGRYVQVFVTLDDSGVGVFRDALNLNNASLSSITVDSTPLSVPPDKRLRHGAWFANDILQPFETSASASCS